MIIRKETIEEYKKSGIDDSPNNWHIFKCAYELGVKNTDKKYSECLLSILDTLKLFDNNSLNIEYETLSEIMFRKMNGCNINLNKLCGFTHLKPVKKKR